MSTLANLLIGSRQRGRCAFIPFIMAGDPALHWTAEFMRALAEGGADIIELGVPFSDPIADGPVNQRASERALKAGAALPQIIEFVARMRLEGIDTPVVLFTYLNPVLRMGLRRFSREIQEARVQGALVVDLPLEEAAEYRGALDRCGVETVFLASPTTTRPRLRLIGAASTGFVYYVSRLGVTGESPRLARTLVAEVEQVRRVVKRPVAVGFGISTPEQARSVAAHADAVVVGSALVRVIAEHQPQEAARRLRRASEAMTAALKG